MTTGLTFTPTLISLSSYMDLPFVEFLYFTVVTLTTVGYGVYLNIGEQPGIMI